MGVEIGATMGVEIGATPGVEKRHLFSSKKSKSVSVKNVIDNRNI